MSRQIKDPISGSWLTTAGYDAIDNALDPNSRNPVENRVVTEQFNAVNTKVGELSDLDTTDKSSIVAAINEVKDSLSTISFDKEVTIQANSSDGFTITNDVVNLLGNINRLRAFDVFLNYSTNYYYLKVECKVLGTAVYFRVVNSGSNNITNNLHIVLYYN